jgi:hypothetical protein
VPLGVDDSGLLAPTSVPVALALFWALLDGQNASEVEGLVSGLAGEAFERPVVAELQDATWDEVFPGLSTTIDYLETYRDWTAPADYDERVSWLDQRLHGRLHIVGAPNPTTVGHLIRAQTVPDAVWAIIANSLEAAGGEFTIGGGPLNYLSAFTAFTGLFDANAWEDAQLDEETPADFFARTGDFRMGGYTDADDLMPDGGPTYEVFDDTVVADLWALALAHEVSHGLDFRAPILRRASGSREWRDIHAAIVALDHQLATHWLSPEEAYGHAFALWRSHEVDPANSALYVELGADRMRDGEADASAARPAEEVAARIIEYFDGQIHRPWTAPVDPADWTAFLPTVQHPFTRLVQQFEADPEFCTALWPHLDVNELSSAVANWERVRDALAQLWPAANGDRSAGDRWRSADDLAAGAQLLLYHRAVVGHVFETVAWVGDAARRAPAAMRMRAYWAWREARLAGWSYSAQIADPTRSWDHVQLGGTPAQADFGRLVLAARLVDLLGAERAHPYLESVRLGVLPDGAPFAGMSVTDAAQHFVADSARTSPDAGTASSSPEP